MVSVLYPSEFSHKFRDGKADDGGDDETTEDYAEGEFPFGKTDLDGRVYRAENADKPRCAHTAADGVAAKSENAGGERSDDYAGYDGRHHYLRVTHKVWDLQHTRAYTLRDKPSPLVFVTLTGLQGFSR